LPEANYLEQSFQHDRISLKQLLLQQVLKLRDLINFDERDLIREDLLRFNSEKTLRPKEKADLDEASLLMVTKSATNLDRGQVRLPP